MIDAKKALTETDGDMEAAVDWLRTKGLAKAAKKSGRTAAEGLVGRALGFLRESYADPDCPKPAGGLPFRWAIKAFLPLGFLLLTLAALSRPAPASDACA